MISIPLNKLVSRTLIISVYIAVIAIILVGISKVIGYLNTGADRSLMLHTKIYETVHYQPQITWTTANNMGRHIDKTTLQSIEKDYLNSWYVKQIALKNNTNKGLKNYYTKSALSNLTKNITHNTNNNISIESTTLKHQPSIDFFSEDGQTVLITDENIIEKKEIYQNQKLILESSEQNTYQFLLLLEDGFWKIRQVLKISPTKNTTSTLANLTLHHQIKGINYYPQNTPWNMFGDEFDITTIEKDFDLIQKSGLNTIRIFIQYNDFGKSEIKPEKIKKLQQVLDIANQKKLKAIVTLFDFYGDYSVIDWTLNNKHALGIVNAIKNHPALLAWDIKNEPNLDFNSRGKKRVTAWLTQMVNHVKIIDTIHPVTIGWSNTKSASILANKVDFVSFHYYEDLKDLSTKYQKMKKEIPNKTIVLGEYGMSNYRGIWNPFGSSEKDQAEYHQKFQEIAQQHQIPFISWTLYDFTKIPKEVVGKLPWRKNNQKHFGFINNKGEKKKSFNFITKP